MLSIGYPILVGALIAGAIGLREAVGARRIWTSIFRIAFVMWTVVIVGLALFPLPVFPDTIRLMREFIEGPPSINLVPLSTIAGGFSGAQGPQQPLLVIGNLIAFIPVGVLAPMLGPRLRSFGRVIALGLAISLAIECSQLALSTLYGFAWKSFDVDDLLLNATGAGVGYVIFALFLGEYLIPLLQPDSSPARRRS